MNAVASRGMSVTADGVNRVDETRAYRSSTGLMYVIGCASHEILHDLVVSSCKATRVVGADSERPDTVVVLGASSLALVPEKAAACAPIVLFPDAFDLSPTGKFGFLHRVRRFGTGRLNMVVFTDANISTRLRRLGLRAPLAFHQHDPRLVEQWIRRAHAFGHGLEVGTK